MSDKPNLSYAECGVDIDAGNAFIGRIKQAVASTTRPEVLAGLGGFGGLFGANFKDYKEPVLVSGTDGVGTKLLLHQQYDTPEFAGQDVVAMCVNDIAAQGAEPLFFLDYLATGKLEGDTLTRVVEGVAKACRISGCALIGGETAEMPGMYAPGHYDIAGFSVGVVERSRIIDGSKISEGDIILGLASSGPHSNGYSLVRKLLEIGKADLHNDKLSDGTPALEGVMAPTRLYVPAVKALMDANVDVHGFSHITGGGMYDNLERILPDGLAAHVDVSSWKVPPVFEYLLSFANVEKAERYRTLNMGIGFVVFVPETAQLEAEDLLRQTGEQVFTIGQVTRRQKETVVLEGMH